MIAADETELGWLRSVREARYDMIHMPALPVAPWTVPDDDGYYLCSGCGLVPETRAAFLDADGWIWCKRCATSDVVGAAFTQSEIIHLSGMLCSAVSRCEHQAAVHRFADAEDGRRREALAELRALRDVLTLLPVGRPVPVDELFAGVQS